MADWRWVADEDIEGNLVIYSVSIYKIKEKGKVVYHVYTTVAAQEEEDNGPNVGDGSLATLPNLKKILEKIKQWS